MNGIGTTSRSVESNYFEVCENFIEHLVETLDDQQIHPRLNHYGDVVLLALLDKVVTTARAVLCLVRQGFAADAFGLSRTAMEACIVLRFIENNSTEERAKRYLDYFGKDRERLAQIVAKYHPNSSGRFSSDHEMLLEKAKQFKSFHKWFEEDLKAAACEASAWKVDDSGAPDKWDYVYDVPYRYTSHEVHATSVALQARIAEFFTYSRCPPSFAFAKRTLLNDGIDSVFTVCLYSQAAVDCVFHGFDLKVPTSIPERFADCKTAFRLTDP
jgi:hypothetical protein